MNPWIRLRGAWRVVNASGTNHTAGNRNVPFSTTRKKNKQISKKKKKNKCMQSSIILQSKKLSNTNAITLQLEIMIPFHSIKHKNIYYK
jgi:hypothetical protein